MRRALLLASIFVFVLTTTANARLQIGVQDDMQLRNDPSAFFDAGHELRAEWVRMIVNIDEGGVADRIRAAHASGFHVILTVGGIGTDSRTPSFDASVRYIDTLPRAERYTIGNEPDIDGFDPCEYRRGWMKARRLLGRRLLWGDFSPHRPFIFTVAARMCGPLPKHLAIAVHPYQATDPLAPSVDTDWEGGIGNLERGRRLLRAVGIRVTWWLDEFGYGSKWGGQSTTDSRAAWLWPRAFKRARLIKAKVLVVYTARGSTWNTRPGEQGWSALMELCAL